MSLNLRHDTVTEVVDRTISLVPVTYDVIPKKLLSMGHLSTVAGISLKGCMTRYNCHETMTSCRRNLTSASQTQSN